MRIPNSSGRCIAIFTLCICCFGTPSIAAEPFPFQARIREEGINIRADATANSSIICKVARDQELTVVREAYDWYKVILPEYAPSYIKKNFVTLFDSQTVRVTADRVNIRLDSNESSPIIGKAEQNELFTIVRDAVGWYRVRPSEACTGWVHMNFLQKIAYEQPVRLPAPVEVVPPAPVVEPAPAVEPAPLPEPAQPAVTAFESGSLVLVGVVESYGRVIRRLATHKLVTAEKKTYLLRYAPEKLSVALYRKVRVTGTEMPEYRQQYPVIAVIDMEFLD